MDCFRYLTVGKQVGKVRLENMADKGFLEHWCILIK